MSSGGACVRFKQNAWKKELCSNCYRPKEEHQEQPKPPPPSLPLIDPSQSILVNLKKKKKLKKKSVSFTEQESEVIGYGGADSSSEDDDYEWVETKEEEREVIGEEEKALERLTKTNTDYNSLLGNLNSNTGLLPLGKQQKQTLHVTIQPFGMSDNNKKTNLNKLVQEEAPVITPIAEIKETKPPEVKEDGKEKEEQPMPLMKTIVIENKVPVKEETRGTPEGRKTQITRGSMITKNHEQVKNKLYIQNVIQTKIENRRSITQLKDDNDNKTETEINKIIINTGPNVEEKNARNTTEGEVTVKVLKLVGNGLAESREMAGEPDGRADSDEPETPLTPPPRASFLHREAHLALTVPPSEPTPPVQAPPAPQAPLTSQTQTAPQAQPTFQAQTVPQAQPTPPLSMPTPLPVHTTPPPTPPPPSPPASPPARSKRPAPKPPAPDTRRRASLTDSGDKKKTRVRHTLRKLLRFGSREEEPKTPEDEGPPRPRPQIIHPLDLNKSAVEVLPPASPEKTAPEFYNSTASLTTYSVGRPSKPPPPPRSESLNLMERLRPSPNSENNVYANLGEGRCGITPVKPQRTGSMRDANSTTKDSVTKESSKQCTIQNDSDNVYECVGVSSAPECDMSLPTYYGSETESDIYYPYISFQNGECKTKLKRKERGIVHSTLEENYGAVIIANHDALTNLFHQLMSKKPDLPKEMQGVEWKWNCFDVDEEDVQKLGNLTFVNGRIKEIPITLSVTSIESTIPDIMEPLTQFKSTVPIKCLQNGSNAFITVMRRKKIERLSTFAKKLEKSAESVREGVYILLQVVKYLSVSKGKVNTENFVVFTSENSLSAAYLPAEDNETICAEDCLREMCKQLLGPLPLGRIVEKCNIAEAEGVLEVWLWGPASPLALPSLARWLDLERANFLNALVSNRNNAAVDKEQLAFLVRATPKSIAHSSQIIEHNAS